MNIYDELAWRGLIFQESDAEALKELLSKPGRVVYAGFDPTAASLHIGSLVPLVSLKRFQMAGHRPIALVGGATGLIGDPSGKTAERTLNTDETVRRFAEGIRGQIEKFVDVSTEPNPGWVLNNLDWTAPMTVIEFLRDVGKYFSVNQMIAKESVKARLEREEVGISYTEFSYQILQSYDFYHLFEEHNCELQVGGADQWGNMTSGMEFVRKKAGGDVHCMTFPLITTSSGTKFGKTEAGAVWLDPEMTSPYAFYQYWINVDDRDVVKFLKYFTFLSKEQIEELEEKVRTQPETREAQRTLAYEVTRMIHGQEEVDQVVAASEALFGKRDLAEVNMKTLNQAVDAAPTVEYSAGSGATIVDLLVDSGLVKSKSQAREAVTSGGVYVNNQRVSEIDFRPAETDFLHGSVMLLRRGKKNYAVVRLKG